MVCQKSSQVKHNFLKVQSNFSKNGGKLPRLRKAHRKSLAFIHLYKLKLIVYDTTSTLNFIQPPTVARHASRLSSPDS